MKKLSAFDLGLMNGLAWGLVLAGLLPSPVSLTNKLTAVIVACLISMLTVLSIYFRRKGK